MKKSALFIISFLILNLFLISISAQDAFPSDVNELNKLQEIGNKLSNEEQREFLIKDFSDDLIGTPFFGGIMNFLDLISPVTDPIFLFILKTEPSLSWLFVLTLLLWIAIIINTYRTLSLISVFSKITHKVISIGIIIIISILGIAKLIAEYIINAISILPSWWLQSIAAGLIIVALLFASISSKGILLLSKKARENKKEKEEEEDREKLKTEVEVAEALTKDATS